MRKLLGNGAIFMFMMHLDSGAKGEGGAADEEKTKALNLVKDTATEAAKAAVKELEKKLTDLGEKADKTEIEALKTALKEATDELQEQHDKLSGKVNSNSVTVEKGHSFALDVKAAVGKNEEALKGLYAENNGQKVNLKAATTTITTSLVSPEVATARPFTLTSFDSEIDSAPKRPTFMRQLVRVIATNNMLVAWAEKVIEGGADWTAEAAKKNQMSIKFQERSKKVEKVTAFIKASKEALADISFLMSEINGELRDAIELKLDESIL